MAAGQKCRAAPGPYRARAGPCALLSVWCACAAACLCVGVVGTLCLCPLNDEISDKWPLNINSPRP